MNTNRLNRRDFLARALGAAAGAMLGQCAVRGNADPQPANFLRRPGPSMPHTGQIIIHPDVTLHRVSRYIYSHFAEHLGRCIYGGIWVGEDSDIENDGGLRIDTVEALRKLALPALRWPGGCFADNYHWRDGVGLRQQRPRRYNLWWRQPESNQFGTNEFMRLCRLIGAEPYICLNVGSGTPEEARGWVEYCNSDADTSIVRLRRSNGHPEPYNVKFWGIGNESWGCGGNMKPEYYADLFGRFATYVRKEAGPEAKLVACGSHPGIPEWDQRFLEAMNRKISLVDHLALHIYSGGGSSDVDFSDEDYDRVIAAIDVMETNLTRAAGLTQAYSTDRHRIGVLLDEWGTWYRQATVESGLYQQNTMRDALFAAASFHLFHRLADRLFMTNMAQTVNVLQALVLTDGPRMIVTPTYHVYDMFRPHRDGTLVPSEVIDAPPLPSREGESRPGVSVSVTSLEGRDSVFASVVNLHLQEDFTAAIRLTTDRRWRITRIRRLATGDVRAHNTFEEPENVQPQDMVGDGKREMTFPAASITTLLIEYT